MAQVLPQGFLILGPELARQEEIERLCRSLLGKEPSALNVHKYYGDEFNASDFLEQARTAPLFGACQILWIRRGGKLSKSDTEAVLSLLEKKIHFTRLVVEDSSLPAGSLLEKGFSEHGRVIRLAPWNEIQKKSWLRRRFKEEGLEIPGEILEVLCERSGEDPGELEGTLEKLFLRLRGAPPVEREEMLALIDDASRYRSFDLVEALSQKDLRGSLEIFTFLYEREAQAIPALLGLLHWHFKRLWFFKEGLEEGLRPDQMMRRSRLSQAAFQKVRWLAQQWDRKGLEAILQSLFEFDLEVKQGAVEERIGFETLLVRICSV